MPFLAFSHTVMALNCFSKAVFAAFFQGKEVKMPVFGAFDGFSMELHEFTPIFDTVMGDNGFSCYQNSKIAAKFHLLTERPLK